MKTIKLAFVFLALGVISLTSCKDKSQEPVVQDSIPMHQQMDNSTAQLAYQMGDVVPSDQVCMVNNAFMGTEQLIVEHDGKTYYGCCEMCQKQIPTDRTARVAVDPYSQKEVDKSEAVIAITGERGQVSYFENKDNFEKYIKTLN